jgi:hypothetical protein
VLGGGTRLRAYGMIGGNHVNSLIVGCGQRIALGASPGDPRSTSLHVGRAVSITIRWARPTCIASHAYDALHVGECSQTVSAKSHPRVVIARL